jgi:glycine/sarcosine N-methyltransferase
LGAGEDSDDLTLVHGNPAKQAQIGKSSNDIVQLVKRSSGLHPPEGVSMSFYSSIVTHYDEIFPLSAQEAVFTSQLAEEHGCQTMLDIGCGSGALAYAMTPHVQRIEAFDYDQAMVDKAISLRSHPIIHFRQGDMRRLVAMYAPASYDLITCYGNTLVHVPQEEALAVLPQVYDLLTEGGAFACQILNYEHIFAEKITELPLIERASLRFERWYELLSPQKVLFHSRLALADDDGEVENVISLYPLTKDELAAGLEQAGFKHLRWYSNFAGDAYHGAHLPLIVTARK